jgi:hypothetical protein
MLEIKGSLASRNQWQLKKESYFRESIEWSGEESK